MVVLAGIFEPVAGIILNPLGFDLKKFWNYWKDFLNLDKYNLHGSSQ